MAAGAEHEGLARLVFDLLLLPSFLSFILLWMCLSVHLSLCLTDLFVYLSVCLSVCVLPVDILSLPDRVLQTTLGKIVHPIISAAMECMKADIRKAQDLPSLLFHLAFFSDFFFSLFCCVVYLFI